MVLLRGVLIDLFGIFMFVLLLSSILVMFVLLLLVV